MAAGLRANTDGLVESESELALLEMDRGRWDESVKYLRVALTEIDRHRLHDYPMSGLAFAGAARLALHRADVDGARRELTRAMRVRPGCTYALSWLAVRVRLHLAKAYLVSGDLAAVRHLLHEIDDVLHKRPKLGALVDQVTEFRRAVASSVPMAAAGAPPLTPAELRLLPYTTAVLRCPSCASPK